MNELSTSKDYDITGGIIINSLWCRNGASYRRIHIAPGSSIEFNREPGHCCLLIVEQGRASVNFGNPKEYTVLSTGDVVDFSIYNYKIVRNIGPELLLLSEIILPEMEEAI